MSFTDKIVPEAEQIRKALWELTEDAARYRVLKARYSGADFIRPSASGQGTRCVLIFDWPEQHPVSKWPEQHPVSKSLDMTVDHLRDLEQPPPEAPHRRLDETSRKWVCDTCGYPMFKPSAGCPYPGNHGRG